jgi:hypothetical protein
LVRCGPSGAYRMRPSRPAASSLSPFTSRTPWSGPGSTMPQPIRFADGAGCHHVNRRLRRWPSTVPAGGVAAPAGSRPFPSNSRPAAAPAPKPTWGSKPKPSKFLEALPINGLAQPDGTRGKTPGKLKPLIQWAKPRSRILSMLGLCHYQIRLYRLGKTRF